MNSVKWLSVILLCATVVACTPTDVQFSKPTGTKMELNGAKTWPCTVKLDRPDKAGESQAYPVTLQLPSNEGLVKVVGTLRLFAYEPPTGETLPNYVVDIKGDDLKKLYKGETVTLTQTDKKGNKLYEMVVGQGSTKVQN